MRALKAFVIGMAILLSVGVVVVVVAIVQRAGDVGVPAPEPVAASALPSFDKSRLVLPAGAEIVDMVAEGERLILRLRLAGGGEQLIVLDLGSGRTLGTVELERAP